MKLFREDWIKKNKEIIAEISLIPKEGVRVSEMIDIPLRRKSHK
jgi:hypothetical protein